MLLLLAVEVVAAEIAVTNAMAMVIVDGSSGGGGPTSTEWIHRLNGFT